MIGEKEQKFMIELARNAITNHPKNISAGNFEKISPMLKEKRGVFVTLTIDGELRGCIGYIEPIKTLYESIIDNAINAAYHDPRFLPVSKSELGKIKIEISILTKPQRLDYADAGDLLEKLNQNYGIIIRKGLRNATFLPQVWEQIPGKEEFLAHLCMKAGLHPNEWKESELEVLYYQVEKFEG